MKCQLEISTTFLHHSHSLRGSFFVIVCLMAGILFSNTSICAEQISVKVGSYENNPKISIDENNVVSGFWPELLEYIAKKEDWKVEYIQGTWSEGLARLEQEQIDILPDVAFTEKRNSLYTFSDEPVLMSWSRLYIHKDNSEIHSIQDLSNRKIAALENSVNLEGAGGLREILDGFNIHCEIVELGNYDEVFQAIDEGRVDGGITNRNFGNKNAKYYAVKNTPILFQPINIKFAFPRDSSTTTLFAKRINYHMAELIADDTSIYYQLLKKYFEAGITEKRVETFPTWLKIVLQLFILLIGICIIIILATRFQVQRKTKEIQEMNKTLRLSEEKFRILADRSPDVRYRTDVEGKVVYISQNVYKLFGYTAEESIGMNVADLYVDPEERIKFSGILQQNGHVNNFVTKVKRKDGSIWWAATSAQFYKDRDGKNLGVDGITRDVTEAKEAELAISRSEKRWDRTFNSFTDIVTLQDTDLCVIKANKAARNCFESLHGDIDGVHCYELFNDALEICPNCPILETKKEFQPFSREVYHEKLDKTFLVSATPVFDEHGKLEYIAHVAKDITDWKQLEERLFLTEKMTSIAGLAAGVAHEINTPLSGIIQSSQVVEMGLNPDFPQNQKIAAKHGLDLSLVQAYLKEQDLYFFLGSIKSSVIKASETIKRLLEFSRPQDGGFSTHDLNKLVQDALALAKSDYNLRKKYDIIKLKVVEEYGTDIPDIICVGMEIEQVVLNLINNGIQAMVEKEIKDRCLSLRTFKVGELARIEVEDNGMGLDNEIQKQMFNPFFSTKDVGQGTGLGLSVSYAIICDKHHGKIWVESEPGKGAKFIVELPLAQQVDVSKIPLN